MNDARPHRTPGPDGPISIERSAAHVVVSSRWAVVAETDQALELREASHPVVVYVPLDDTDQERPGPQRTPHGLPNKGEARHYDLAAAACDYADRLRAVAQINGHVAFYTDRVTVSPDPHVSAPEYEGAA
jgi:uncharacterized protein (DUF427 family)